MPRMRGAASNAGLSGVVPDQRRGPDGEDVARRAEGPLQLDVALVPPQPGSSTFTVGYIRPDPDAPSWHGGPGCCTPQ